MEYPWGLGCLLSTNLSFSFCVAKLCWIPFFYYSCCTYEICVRHSSIHIPHIFLSLARQVGRGVEVRVYDWLSLIVMFSFFLQVLAFYKCRMRWCSSSAFHLLRCVRLRLCSRRGQNRLPLWIREIWAYMRLLAKSLYFNSLTDSDVVFDSVFEPVFLTVDYVTRWFGLVSVLLNGYEKVVVVVFLFIFWRPLQWWKIRTLTFLELVKIWSSIHRSQLLFVV